MDIRTVYANKAGAELQNAGAKRIPRQSFGCNMTLQIVHVSEYLIQFVNFKRNLSALK